MPASTPFSRRAIPLLLAAAFLLFATGVFFPFFHVTKFWVFGSAVSVVGGLITSRRGNLGGYRLARAPEEISLYDIMIATEGECLGLSGNFAGQSGRRLKQVWGEVRAALIDKVKSYTLDQIAAKAPGEMYYI